MALVRTTRIPVEEFDGSIRFFMMDGSATIECRVTRDALDARALRDALNIFKSGEIFLEYRGLIEQAADRLFSAGASKPVIESF